ncbi:DUF3576 domain-containing protein [Candidatus Pelagibacter sp. HIMB1611]|uniref:DUF3576 domain-containing protein n=1 Tax=unclassified Candidatus Pelagibacter TaxID=2647897 RepID=UPI003F865DF4
MLEKINSFILKACLLLTISIFFYSCGKSTSGTFLPGGNARENSPDPSLRVQKNLEEGKGFRLMDEVENRGSGNFEFASSNELWRASLDVIDFMPLTSANYSGGIIITDWYSENSEGESIKITIRFLSNEIRADALEIKVFLKKCDVNLNCKISEKSSNLSIELQKEILKKAAIYEKQNVDKNFKPYKVIDSRPNS